VTRWFTSDLHLGHANIIGYCDRPWPDVEAMDRGLVERWNEVVADGDEVWVLGDVAMGRIEHSLGLIRSLAGTKLLVPGNHDRCWPGRGSSAADWARQYREAGFAEVLPEVVDLTLAGGSDGINGAAGSTGIPARACHFPYWGDSHDEERFAGHRPVDDGRLLLHGHVHTR